MISWTVRAIPTLALTLCVACSAPEQKQAESSTTPPAESTTTTTEVQPQPATAQDVAEAISTTIPEITELIEITEDNDPNNLIGRPNGYVAATVLVDSRLPGCDGPGTNCGAMIEQWPDQAAAQKRSDYIQTLRESMPMLGQEWNTINGGLLLRVSGELKPSDAQAYEATFTR